MIKLENINKFYTNSSGIRTIGLNNVNIEFECKGFVTIVGRSGSGKSTLLNILAGFDSFDNGDYLFNGESTIEFDDIKWDYFRRNSIGFVFQDFNLVSELNVIENIKLSLGEETDKNLCDIDRILCMLEIEDCREKNINELSGGEAQRVSIARAIIKNPKVILADEPTGNLDEKSSKIVLDYLKLISRDILVILVTHDMEYADKYSDIVYRLSDGEIIEKREIEAPQSDANDFKMGIPEKSIETKLPVEVYKSIIQKNLGLKKKTFVLSILQFCLSFLLAYLVISIITFNFGDVSIRSLRANDIDQYNFIYDNNCFSSCIDQNRLLRDTIYNIDSEFENSNILLLVNSPIYYSDFDDYLALEDIFIQRNQINYLAIYDQGDLEDRLIGEESRAPNEIVLSDYVAEMLIHYNIVDVSDVSDMIGQIINLPIDYSYYNFIVVGLVDTDYENYLSLGTSSLDSEKSLFGYKVENDYSLIFLTQENLTYIKDNSRSVSVLFSSINNGLIINEIGDFDYILTKYSSYTIYGSEPLEENEIVLPLSTILREEGISLLEFTSDSATYINLYVGSSYEFIGNYDSDNPLSEGYIVVGIIDDTDFSSNDYNLRIMYVANIYFENLYDEYFDYLGFSGKVYLSGEDASVLNYIIESDYYYRTSISVYLYDVYGALSKLEDLVYIITAIVFALIFLQIYLFANNSVKRKTKLIGILRSQGISKRNIANMFMLESVIYTSLSFILFLLIAILFNYLIDKVLLETYGYRFTIFYFTVARLMLIVASALLITFLSTILPIKSIFKKEPIETIKAIE